MLQELRVENLLLMERAELRLGPGLNVLTGETGAGKTLLAHALDLLLGGRARRGIVRPGAAEAYVEGVFDLDPALVADERIPTDAEELVLARRVWPDGRTRAYVCGRAATQADLQELGGRLLAFYGQHEHRRLMLSVEQLELLDAYGGSQHASVRRRLAESHERVRALGGRVADLGELAGSRDRELDLLRFELDEIEAAEPRESEGAELAAERDRLRHQGDLIEAGAFGAEALAGESGGVAEAIAGAGARVAAAAELDPGLRELADRLMALQYEAADLGAELRGYVEGLAGEGGETAPGARLQEVEERLAVLARLERKHGGSIAEVLAHAERCRRRYEELTGAESDLESVQAELSAAADERDALADRLTRARAKAAPRLARAVRERLAELAMGDARFEIAIAPREGGCGPRGVDAIEMEIAPNGDENLAPLREVASGGELSRVMLALLSVAHGSAQGSDPAARGMLVFDEIDAGIGGHTARAVGEHLRALAVGRQVLCITHLPQVAALGERHFTIVKDTRARPARTTVITLEGDAVVAELVRMMGAAEEDAGAADHARELLKVVA
ncbi:MAG TPA: DNA repair protein RecN [Solirubrobacteraceae bacterium]|nr:DNA repair protein RecN [Solirubrobacteraceae bacterium]